MRTEQKQKLAQRRRLVILQNREQADWKPFAVSRSAEQHGEPFPLHPIVREVFAAAGFSFDDIVSWGGQVRYDDGLPMKSNRFAAMLNGEVDMIIDEAVRSCSNSRNSA